MDTSNSANNKILILSSRSQYLGFGSYEYNLNRRDLLLLPQSLNPTPSVPVRIYILLAVTLCVGGREE